MATGAGYGYVSQVNENLSKGKSYQEALTTDIKPEPIVNDALIAGAIPIVAMIAATTASALIPAGITAACADGDCTNEVVTGENAIQSGLDGIKNNTGNGYKSFEAFKNAEGKAGDGWAWHHIVNQTTENIEKFGEETIHNTNNLVRLPDNKGEIHRQITGFYNSINYGITGSTTMRVREWISRQSFEAQWRFGINVIQRFGGEQHIINKFNTN